MQSPPRPPSARTGKCCELLSTPPHRACSKEMLADAAMAALPALLLAQVNACMSPAAHLARKRFGWLPWEV